MQRNFIFNGGYSTRWHTLDVHNRQDIGNHSFGVAWLCELITRGSASKCLIMAALAHDLAEHIVGDIPSPAKRALGISKMFDEFEGKHLAEAGVAFYGDELELDETAILKFADMLEGMMFCLRERKFGNRNVDIVFQRFRSYVLELLGKHPSYDKLHFSAEVLRIHLEIVNEWKELTDEPTGKRELATGSGEPLSINITALGLGTGTEHAVPTSAGDEVFDALEKKERGTGS